MMQKLNVGQARAVAEFRAAGRTDRQVEKLTGLSNGFLSRPWVIDQADVQARAEDNRRRAASEQGFRSFLRSFVVADRNLSGWRPDGDCVTARPDAKPLRSVPRPTGKRGVA